jgi:hypothetical protein
MKKFFTAFVFLVFISISIAAPEQHSFIIMQVDSPLVLSKPSFKIEQNRSSESVIVNAEYTNKSKKAISALSLGFIFYGPFNNQLDSRGGLDLRNQGRAKDLDSDQQDAGTWEFNFSGDFSTTTMIVFVNRVRFLDGTIWQADVKELDAGIRALTGSGFDPASLK